KLFGAWVLIEKTCELDGSFIEKLKVKVNRADQMGYAGEILIISDDNVIRRFDQSGRMIVENDYILADSNKFLVENELFVKGSPGRLKIRQPLMNRLITEHKGDSKCKGGTVKANYTKVQTRPHYSYGNEL
ncbi:MAG: hypothetical protein AABZ31_05910, partial [Bdellovibrionota bacterium]